MAASRVDVLALNRIVGLGVATPPSDAQLQEVVERFHAIGSPRFFIPVAPVEGHAALAARIERLGTRHYNNWMRLSRGLNDLPAPDRGNLDIRQIGPDEGERFAAIVGTAFGYPPVITPIMSQVIGRSNWRHYLACAAGVPVAAAAMYVAGEAAWFGFAATNADARGRGAQTALIVRRLVDAAALGCRWVSVETAEDTVQRNAPSFRNLRRLGFEVAYTRPNYLWIRSGAAA
jgi:hypothetical protein